MGNPRIMMTEAYGLDASELVKYYGDSASITDQVGKLSHMPLFFDMIKNFKKPNTLDAKTVSETIQGYIDKLPLDKKTMEAKAGYEATAKQDDPKFVIPP